MKRIIPLLISLIWGLTFRAQVPFTVNETLPKYEVRGVWITTLGGLDWPRAKASTPAGREKQKEELITLLDQLQKCKINTIFLQTRVRGSVIYPSKIEPWDVALTGQYDKDPGYDPLAFAIEEAHKRNMEVHAWVVSVPCFKIAQAKRIGKKSLINTHPTLLKKFEDTYYLDPGMPGSAPYLASICHEIVQKYDVDGIHLDYIRYPENAGSFPDGATYKKYGQKQDKASWRRANITALVKSVYTDVKQLKPWIRVSCSPVGKYRDVTRFSAKGWAAYTTVHQDAQGWLRDGIMDMLCPMMYFQGDHFYPFAADWQENCYGRTIVPGLGIYFMSPKEKNWEWTVIQRELAYLRQQGIPGEAYFRSQFLTDNTKGIYDYLVDTYYPYPSLMPPMTWQDSTLPDTPSLKGRERVTGVMERLTWTPVQKGTQPCRYVIYASHEYPVDVNKAQNIVKVVNEPEYTYSLLTTTFYDMHVAITALDRFGNESEPLRLD